jgi:hypothetical protein
MAGSRSKKAILLGALTVSLALSGCATEPEAESAAAPRAQAQEKLVENLRAGISFEYVPFATPAEAERDADVVVAGRVRSIEPALMNNEVGQEGTALLELVPTNVWKSRAPGRAEAEPVRVLLYRARNAPIEPYREALPEGTQIVVFGYLREGIDFDGDIPDGSAYELAPQSLHLPVGNQLVNVWGADSGGEWPGVDSVADFDQAFGHSKKP